MKAVVLAAGKGERLKPITDRMPKPMIKIGGKPILEHVIELLKKYNIKEIFINLHYLPQIITEYFENGNRWDVDITYSYERELLGTAGAVKSFQEFLDSEHFFVIYGDNLINFNLNELLNFHIQKEGIGTIALYKKKYVKHSGIVLLDKDKKIIKFKEKPQKGQIFSNLVNTGVFILEPKIFMYIPENKYSDFGYNIFPDLLEKGEKLFGLEMDGELIAIDTLSLYKSIMKRRRNDNNSNSI